MKKNVLGLPGDRILRLGGMRVVFHFKLSNRNPSPRTINKTVRRRRYMNGDDTHLGDLDIETYITSEAVEQDIADLIALGYKEESL